MAPLGKATRVQAIDAKDSKDLPTAETFDEEQCYAGVIDPTWNIGRLINLNVVFLTEAGLLSRKDVSFTLTGTPLGYVLGLILESAIQFQSTRKHVDALHVTAHFLRTTAPTPFTIRIRVIKVSSGFTNLVGDFFQEGTHKITTHCIFGVNAPHPKDKVNLTLNPPSTYARRHPLPTHPATAKVRAARGGPDWAFNKEIKWTEEVEVLARNDVNSPTRTNSSTVGGGGLEWASWAELTDKDEKITIPSLAFLADMFVNTPALLPRSERKGLGMSWFPTMTMSIEFKNKIPPASSKHSDRTVGLYSYGRFMTEPQGRHEIYLEAWTAPSNIGEGIPTADWRDDQVCIATATQMALVMPFEINQRKGKTKDTKL